MSRGVLPESKCILETALWSWGAAGRVVVAKLYRSKKTFEKKDLKKIEKKNLKKKLAKNIKNMIFEIFGILKILRFWIRDFEIFENVHIFRQLFHKFRKIRS